MTGANMVRRREKRVRGKKKEEVSRWYLTSRLGGSSTNLAFCHPLFIRFFYGMNK